MKLSSREGLTLGRKVKVDEPSEIRWILRGTIPANYDSSWTFYSGEEAVFEKYIVPWLGDLGVTVPKLIILRKDQYGCVNFVGNFYKSRENILAREKDAWIVPPDWCVSKAFKPVGHSCEGIAFGRFARTAKKYFHLNLEK